MTDTLAVDLHDSELIDEIHLVAELMVLASESQWPLDARTIDRVLGVLPARPGTDTTPHQTPRVPGQRGG